MVKSHYEEIDEIDALMAASARARRSVSERAARLLEEHSVRQKELDAEEAMPTEKKAAPEKTTVPADGVIPPAPAQASREEATEWEAYYRYCARGALLRALEENRDAEAELRRRAEGDVDAKRQLDEERRKHWAEVQSRFAAYDVRTVSVPGHDQRLAELDLRYPAPSDIVARVEAEYYGRDTTPVELEPRRVEKKRPRKKLVCRKKKPSPRVEDPAATVASDATMLVPMQDLPMSRPETLKGSLREHAHPVDVRFPSLDSYRRAEHDDAPYFMEGYKAHLSPPHGGGGGYWSGLRAEARTKKKKKSVSAAPAPKAERRAEVGDAKRRFFAALVRDGLVPEDDNDDESREFRLLTAACGAALASVLDDDDLKTRNRLVSAGLAAVIGAATPRRPTAYECERYASCCKRTSFLELARFCAVATTAYDEALDEAVADASAVADDARDLLDEEEIFDHDWWFRTGPLKSLKDFVDALSTTHETLPEAWRAVRAAAVDARDATGVDLPVADEDDPDEGAKATARMYFGDGPFAPDAGFARFALARAAVCAIRDERSCAAAVERDYAKLRNDPPQSRRALEDAVDNMIAQGTLPASARDALDDDVDVQKNSSLADVALDHSLSLDQCQHYFSYFFAHAKDCDDALFVAYAAIMTKLEPHRAGKDLGLFSCPEDDLDDDEPPQDDAPTPPEILFVRALRAAVVRAATTTVGQLDMAAALAALAGDDATPAPREAAALLRPFATHWGGQDGALLAKRDVPEDVVDSVASRLAAGSPNGLVDAAALDAFLRATAATPNTNERTVKFVAPRHFALLELVDATTIRARLFPGDLEDTVTLDDKAATEVRGLADQKSSTTITALARSRLLLEAAFYGADGRLTHPLRSQRY